MNDLDRKKFIDLFVDVTKYGKKSSCSIHDVNEVASKIDKKYFEAWEHYLFDKSDEIDEDSWDDWYENLSLISDNKNVPIISEKDIQVYDLPNKKLTCVLEDSTESLVKFIHNEAKEFIEFAKPFCNNSHNYIHAAYFFDRTGFFIESYLYEGLEDDTTLSKKTKNAIIKDFSEIKRYLKKRFETRVLNEIKLFNSSRTSSQPRIKSTLDHFILTPRNENINKRNSTLDEVAATCIDDDIEDDLGLLGDLNDEGQFFDGVEDYRVFSFTENVIHCGKIPVPIEYYNKIFSVITDENIIN